MFKRIKEFFTKKSEVEIASPSTVPYKIETPVVDTADIALAQLPDGGAAVVEAPKAEIVTSPSTAKKPRTKKATGEKKATTAKTRQRKPKASK
jgi:hypothetical protein